jgi:hypothetical protein
MARLRMDARAAAARNYLKVPLRDAPLVGSLGGRVFDQATSAGDTGSRTATWDADAHQSAVLLELGAA